MQLARWQFIYFGPKHIQMTFSEQCSYSSLTALYDPLAAEALIKRTSVLSSWDSKLPSCDTQGQAQALSAVSSVCCTVVLDRFSCWPPQLYTQTLIFT